jgi:hypothetical protein
MMTADRHLEALRVHITGLREALISHPVYTSIHEIQHVKTFMEHHVYAVWDFMSLLKSLQNQLTCTDVPWMPVGKASVRYLINEIVTGEESDVDQFGVRKSHFELYLEAMEQCGASTAGINQLLQSITGGGSVELALETAPIPQSVRQFLQFTFDVIATQKPHIMAAVFTFGREDLIPNMFHAIVGELHARFPEQLSIFNYYLERHIEVDGDHHGHLAVEMVIELCGKDPEKWQEAIDYSARALESRVALWNGVKQEIRTH